MYMYTQQSTPKTEPINSRNFHPSKRNSNADVSTIVCVYKKNGTALRSLRVKSSNNEMCTLSNTWTCLFFIYINSLHVEVNSFAWRSCGMGVCLCIWVESYRMRMDRKQTESLRYTNAINQPTFRLMVFLCLCNTYSFRLLSFVRLYAFLPCYATGFALLRSKMWIGCVCGASNRFRK